MFIGVNVDISFGVGVVFGNACGERFVSATSEYQFRAAAIAYRSNRDESRARRGGIPSAFDGAPSLGDDGCSDRHGLVLR